MTEKMHNRAVLSADGKFPSDGFYMLAPLGDHPIVARDGDKSLRLVQVIDTAACVSMVNRFNIEKEKNPALELLVDQDHLSDELQNSTEAFGWITELQNRDDGLWGKINWTDLGRPAVEHRRYRFLSPVWSLPNCERLDKFRVRPLVLDEAALTNKPNLVGLTPLVNRQQNSVSTNSKGEEAKMKDKILPILKLAADAGDDIVIDAITKLSNRVGEVEKERDTFKNRVEELEKKELEALVDGDLEKFKDRIVNREEIKALLIKNRADGLKLIAAMAPAVAGEKLHNRESAAQPGTVTEDQKLANKAKEQQACIEEIRVKNRCSYTRAAALAPSIKPELFK